MNKLLLIGGIITAFLVVSVLAAVYIASMDVDVQVNEALSTQLHDISFSTYAGQTATHDITIANAANVPLDARISWAETSNENGVTYTTNMPMTVTIPASGSSVITLSMTIDTGSADGSFSGTVTVDRVASV